MNSAKLSQYLPAILIVSYLFAALGIIWPIMGMFLLVSATAFVILLWQNRLPALIRSLLMVILVQNISYALISSFFVRLFGEEYFVEQVTTNWGRIYSLIFLEWKLLLLGFAVVFISSRDLQQFVKVKTVNVMRTCLYVLFGWLTLLVISQYLAGDSAMSLLGSFRNYSTVLFIGVFGSWVAQKLPNAWDAIFARSFMVPLISLLSVVHVGTIMIFNHSIFWWQEYVGTRYLYFAKLFFETLLPQTATEGRFYTDLLGINFIRTGGIYLEPVNYGYVIAFLLFWLIWAVVKYRKQVDFLLLLVTAVLFVLNMGKGALLFVIIILFTYIYLRVLPQKFPAKYPLWVVIISTFALFVFAIAPLLSKATLGHTEPVEQLSAIVSAVPEIAIVGEGLGTNGNFTAAGEIRESALAVTFVELGGVWLILYFLIVYYAARKIFINKSISPLLAAFAICAMWSFLLSGLFQENIFSLQVSFFTLFAGALCIPRNFEVSLHK